MKNISWIFFKLLFVVLVLVFAGKTVQGNEGDFWVHLGYFSNKSAYPYYVYQSCNPAATPQEIEWTKVLRVVPYNEKQPKDSIAEIDGILLKDPQNLGCVIKIEPTDEGKAQGAKTFYLKQGTLATGNCFFDFAHGPYDLIVSPVLFDFFDDYQEEATKNNKTLVMNNIRYCGYVDSVIGVEIYKDSIKVIPWHRSYVVDQQQHFVEVDGKGN